MMGFAGCCWHWLTLRRTAATGSVSTYLCSVGTVVLFVASYPVGRRRVSLRASSISICGTAQDKVQQLASKACKAVKEVGELTDEEAVLAAEVQMEALWVQNRAHLTLGNDSEAAVIAERVRRSGSRKMCPRAPPPPRQQAALVNSGALPLTSRLRDLQLFYAFGSPGRDHSGDQVALFRGEIT